MDVADRIVDAFDTIGSGVYPRIMSTCVESDVDWIRKRYEKYKGELFDFSEAMRKAKIEFITMLLAAPTDM